MYEVYDYCHESYIEQARARLIMSSSDCFIYFPFLSLNPISSAVSLLDVSQLTASQPVPSTTTQPLSTADPSACSYVRCQNDGVCVVDAGKAVCR